MEFTQEFGAESYWKMSILARRQNVSDKKPTYVLN
jgi:hypothetical protein